MAPKHPIPPMAKVLNFAMLGGCLYGLFYRPSFVGLVKQPLSVTIGNTVDYVGDIAGTLMTPGQERMDLINFTFDYVFGSELGTPEKNNDPVLREFYEWNEWKNSLFLPQAVRDALPHVAAIWLRNYVAIHLVYFGIGALWSAVIYWWKIDHFFPKDKNGNRAMPTREAIKAQMSVSWHAFPLYVMMPTISEWLAERGLTEAYLYPSDVGGIAMTLLLAAVYLFGVEWGIYWVHRYLHENTFLYKWLHWDHHIYNNNNDLSPFAGLAFHPLDGCAQAAPYIIGLFILPVNYWIHLGLLFFTGIWTTNIHDALVGNTEPIMGSKYHTFHHTHYRDNYGQFFVFWDWVHNTLTDPPMDGYGVTDVASKLDSDIDAGLLNPMAKED